MVDHIADGPVVGPDLLEVVEVPTAVVRGTVPVSGLRDFFDTSFRVLPEVVAAQGAAIGGPAFGLYRGVSGESIDLEVGFAVDRAVQPERGVSAGCLPAGRVARVVHVGNFDGLSDAWDRLQVWIGEQGGVAGPVRWEVYHTQPTPDMDPSGLRTELNWLLSD
ncbi:MAG: transcription activator, effector binding [Nocardia sp.]|uniref:GyrI-like domain-containing protein n=1 Tax=Nocardia sp. TaxID=1821 RepID=UPI002611DB62|nr:GyrI-like domain-containing protein [Nocardia sp.]MCU1644200.1 transcription activator, effector binding [Nocardia sp.]